MALVCDTGPIYSSIDRSDPDHATVLDSLRTRLRPHLVTVPTLVEVDSWIRKLLDVGSVLTFDRRHVSIVRPKHCRFLELLP